MVALNLGPLHLVEHQSQQNGDRERPQQGVQAQQHRIPDGGESIVRVEEPLKLLKSHPRAAREAQRRAVILESHCDTVHGDIVEQDDDDYSRQHHDDELPTFQRLEKRRSESASLLRLQGRFFFCHVFYPSLF